jgi:fermentation-respiration switch protein FrsA (DUF1100 family)
MHSIRKAGILLAAILTYGSSPMSSGKDKETDLEASVCGYPQEALAFWFFRNAAGEPDAGRVAHIPDVERLSFTTGDGRVLGGYRLRAAEPRGYLLVAQGNAMLADQILDELAFFRNTGLDVYVYDYRGYGLSEGKSRLKAIVSDYREIVSSLNAQVHGRRFLYGMSMGGVILTNAVGLIDVYDALVVDSSPSRIPHYGCPQAYDPVRNLPQDSAKIMLIFGLRDRVVPPADIEELAEAVQERGGLVLKSPEFAHPLQDLNREIHQRRFQAVADFLAR